MRITLVRPPILQLAKSLSSYGAILPTGLAYVAAVLRQAKHDVAVIDAPVGTLQMNGQLPTGTRSEALDEEVLKLVYETGCRNITYAPESGSERMLGVLKKKVKLPRMLDSLRAARQTGLVTRVNIIIGHPDEERRDTRQSLKLLMKAALIGTQDAAVMIFAPYPGSPDYLRLNAAGKVDISEEYFYLALTRSGWTSRTYNPRMETGELVLWQFGMLMAFYATAYLTRPWRLGDLVRSVISGNEQTQFDQLVRTKLRQFTAKHLS